MSSTSTSTGNVEGKPAPKIILVTGANRGLGNAILRALATAYPSYTYLLGVRSTSNSTSTSSPSSSTSSALTTLRTTFPTTTFHPITLDISSDTSITSAVQHLSTTYPYLDVLINNAGIATLAKPGEDGFREECNRVLDVNCTSFLQLTSALLPLLKKSTSASKSNPALGDGPRPRVINISSARASVHLQTQSKLPPTASIPYSVSKTAMNVMMLEMAKLEPDVLFQAVSPGHCRTALNGFRGKKDPLDGAEVVVRLVGDEEGRWGEGFWEVEEGEVRRVPW